MPDRLPALTDAEAEVLERYARILELLARLHPARTASNVRGCATAAAALAAESAALHRALLTMQERGQDEMFPEVHATVLRHLGVDRHLARLALPD